MNTQVLVWVGAERVTDKGTPVANKDNNQNYRIAYDKLQDGTVTCGSVVSLSHIVIFN